MLGLVKDFFEAPYALVFLLGLFLAAGYLIWGWVT